MIDIHTHILSNLDDGADTPEMTLLMCAAALDADTRTIVATPHFMEGTYEKTSKNKIVEKVEELNKVLQENKIDITVFPGCEAFISLELPELLASGKCSTINGSQYLLVELPMSSIPLYTSNVFFELEIQGITPILAHPERNQEIIRDPKLIEGFLDKGVLVQINSGSITGRMGKRAQDTAWKLLNQGAAHFVSSDAHNLNSRKPGMKTAYDLVMKKCGKANADLLFKLNPQNILKNQSIEEMIPFDRNPLKKLVSSIRKIFPSIK